jgi:hypothetical protein
MANPQKNQPPRHKIDAMALATLGGVVAVLAISVSNWRELDRIETTIGTRLGQIETRVGQVADKVGQAPAARPASGPDPKRVYTINTASAPTKGPASAPVTIAEFSDFQ